MDPEDFMERKAAMKEIRVRRHMGLHADDAGEPLDGGVWFPDSPANRRHMLIIIEEGNRGGGDGSHWLEEREA